MLALLFGDDAALRVHFVGLAAHRADQLHQLPLHACQVAHHAAAAAGQRAAEVAVGDTPGAFAQRPRLGAERGGQPAHDPHADDHAAGRGGEGQTAEQQRRAACRGQRVGGAERGGQVVHLDHRQCRDRGAHQRGAAEGEQQALGDGE
ncbi:MAG: hypothetical protein QM722_24765 [Piscinibacter sp.]